MTAPTAAWISGCTVAGLAIGLGIRRAVFTMSVPPWQAARRGCPNCGRQPGWLRPHGRCSSCGAPVGPSAALLESGTAALFGLVAWRFPPGPPALAFLWLAAVGVALSAIDLAVHRLPDALTLRSYPPLLGLFALAAITNGDGARFAHALLGMLALYLLLAVIPAAAMGLGDVKLSGLIGLARGWLGMEALVTGILVSTAFAAVVGAALIATGRAGWRTHVPFGPFLLAGAFAAMLL